MLTIGATTLTMVVTAQKTPLEAILQEAVYKTSLLVNFQLAGAIPCCDCSIILVVTVLAAVILTKSVCAVVPACDAILAVTQPAVTQLAVAEGITHQALIREAVPAVTVLDLHIPARRVCVTPFVAVTVLAVSVLVDTVPAIEGGAILEEPPSGAVC